ncbi:MAG: exonuclease domain-containing protein [Planctomycetes bacterium]|nr:exonuclease domain-containing protein [Planctomycetota bacterium]
MSKRFDEVVVIDLEATCWEDAPPEGEETEIIEIGVCTLVLDGGERRARSSIIVKPEHSKVSDFCTRLTTLTQKQVQRGIGFAEACAILKKDYHTKDRMWASYGDFDRRLFEEQCRVRKVAYPFGSTHLNVKNVFALFNGLRHEVDLKEAMTIMDLPFEGTHHRGGDDAWNIAAILGKLLHSARSVAD